ncbi:MAG: acyl-CoA thioesterase, partial [Spirochaetota bacterium]
FKRPINLRETIYVRMWVHEKRRASFTISYELIDGDGRVYATAVTVLVAIDAGSGRPAAIPDWFDEAVEQGAARYGETPDKG